MGHARSTNAILVATESGVLKVWGVRRLAEGQRWDNYLITNLRGSPRNWKLDSSEDSELVELDYDGLPEVDGEVRAPTGP